MSKKILIGTVVIALIAIGGFFLVSQTGRLSSGEGKELVLYGNVEIRQVELAFRVSGRLEEVMFEEGDAVTTNDIVARLDATPYSDALKVAQAEVAMRVAELSRLEAGLRPAEIDRARARVAEFEAGVNMAQQNYDRRAVLVQSGAVSRQVFDESVAALRVANERLAAAREDLSIAIEGFRNEEIAAASAGLQAAEAGAVSVQTKVNDANLVAPSDGTILSRINERGSIVQAGEPVLIMALTRPVWIRAYVEEPALGHVAPGALAEIITDSDPDHPYQGQVGFVSPVAEFTPRTVETPDLRSDLVYQVRIIVDAPDDGLRQGMPVTVRLAPPTKRGDQ
ncbi:MAG: secretion protein HlyD [Alphaproteobacteria bacterium]|nr:secretion protein HlyD [Alphaproteobacteria bacterium]